MGLERGVLLLFPVLALACGALLIIGIAVFASRGRLAHALAALSTHQGSIGAVAGLCSLVAEGIVVGLAAAEVFAVTGFWLGVSIGPVHGLLSLLACAGYLWLAARRRFDLRPARAWLVTCAVVGGLIFACLFVASRFYDVSWDGNAYHQPAVVDLGREAWNPIKEPEAHADNPWVTWYPKGAWVRDATVYRITGRIESAKGINLLLIAASFCAVMGLTLPTTPRRRAALLVSMLAAFNPVAVVQTLSFMVDGQVASLLTIALAFSERVLVSPGWPTALALAATLLMLVTAKFTGAASAAIMVAMLIAALVLVRRRGGLRISVALVATMLFAALFVGANPYVHNAVVHGSPVYPLAGRDPVDVITEVMPGDFVGRGRVMKLALSLFSKTTNVQGPGTSTQLKVPLTVSPDELWPYLWSDQRTGGFGPLFGGVLLLAVIALVSGLMVSYLRPVFRSRALLWPLAFIGLTVLLNAESWYARFAPQMWLVSVAVVAVLLLKGRRAWRLGGAMLATLLIADLVIIAAVNGANQVKATGEVTTVLDRVSAMPGPVVLFEHGFTAGHIKLEERGIDYSTADEARSEDVPEAITLPYSPVVVLPADSATR